MFFFLRLRFHFQPHQSDVAVWMQMPIRIHLWFIFAFYFFFFFVGEKVENREMAEQNAWSTLNKIHSKISWFSIFFVVDYTLFLFMCDTRSLQESHEFKRKFQKWNPIELFIPNFLLSFSSHFTYSGCYFARNEKQNVLPLIYSSHSCFIQNVFVWVCVFVCVCTKLFFCVILKRNFYFLFCVLWFRCSLLK